MSRVKYAKDVVCDYIYEIRDECRPKHVLGLLILIMLVVFAISYRIHLDNENIRAIELIHSDSFVGEVIDKQFIAGGVRSLTYISDSYRMHIIGEYISPENEVIQFNRKLTVGKDLYNKYEIGDVISNK